MGANAGDKEHPANIFVSDDPSETEDSNSHNGTKWDQRDMERLGKQQQFKRNFRFISMLGFTSTLMATWENMLSAAAYALIDGGFAGYVYIYLGSFVGFFLVILSMAEMASMSPTTGGQYHWVSEYAPPKWQKFLSYIMGWVCVLGWQTGTASIAFLTGTQIQGLLVLNDSSYVYERWHGTLLVIAVSAFGVLFNTLLIKQLPMIEGIILVLHIFGFFAIIIVLWVLAPRTPAVDVFTSFYNGGGWPSQGLGVLVGMLTPVSGFLGPDSANHMSEEIRDASLVVPRSMMWTMVINGTLGFVMVLTVCFCAGNLQEDLASATGYPFIQMFYTATESKAGTTVLTCIVMALGLCATIAILATASRQLFAFARDNGLPGPRIWAYVIPGWDIPLNAVLLSFFVTVLLSLINIGSTAAFNAIASVSIGAQYTSYICSIGCLVWRRLTNNYIPPARWSLGKWGLSLNILALLYLVWSMIFIFFPTYNHPTASTMNWSFPIYAAVVIISLILYWFRGRHVYEGPVVLIKRAEE